MDHILQSPAGLHTTLDIQPCHDGTSASLASQLGTICVLPRPSRTLPGCWNQWSRLSEPVKRRIVIGSPSGLHQGWVNRARSYKEQRSQTLAPTHHHKRLGRRLKIQNDTHIAINSNRVQKCKFAQSSMWTLPALCHFSLVLQQSSGEQRSYKSSQRPGQVFSFVFL